MSGRTGMAQVPWIPAPSCITFLEVFPRFYLFEISFATICDIASCSFAVILGKKYGSVFLLIPHQVGENISVAPSLSYLSSRMMKIRFLPFFLHTVPSSMQLSSWPSTGQAPVCHLSLELGSLKLDTVIQM